MNIKVKKFTDTEGDLEIKIIRGDKVFAIVDLHFGAIEFTNAAEFDEWIKVLQDAKSAFVKMEAKAA